LDEHGAWLQLDIAVIDEMDKTRLLMHVRNRNKLCFHLTARKQQIHVAFGSLVTLGVIV
jgi:hypothetical protein